MSIEKFDRSNIESIPFTQVNNDVINQIDDMEAFTVWVYLLSKPKDWVVIKAELKTRFKIGNGKLKRIFAYLKDHNLIESRQERLPNGTMGKSEFWVLNGSKFTNKINNPHRGSENRPTVNRPIGSSPLQIKILTNKEKEREQATSLSDNFEPNEDNQKLCQEKGISLSAVLEKFKSYTKSKARKYVDWQAALKKWILDEKNTNIAPANKINRNEATFSSVTSQSTSYKPYKPANAKTDMEAFERKNQS